MIPLFYLLLQTFSVFALGSYSIYYKNFDGIVYGPYPPDQIIGWCEAGYFDGRAYHGELEPRSHDHTFSQDHQISEYQENIDDDTRVGATYEQDSQWDSYNSYTVQNVNSESYQSQNGDWEKKQSSRGIFSLKKSISKLSKKTKKTIKSFLNPNTKSDKESSSKLLGFGASSSQHPNVYTDDWETSEEFPRQTSTDQSSYGMSFEDRDEEFETDESLSLHPNKNSKISSHSSEDENVRFDEGLVSDTKSGASSTSPTSSSTKIQPQSFYESESLTEEEKQYLAEQRDLSPSSSTSASASYLRQQEYRSKDASPLARGDYYSDAEKSYDSEYLDTAAYDYTTGGTFSKSSSPSVTVGSLDRVGAVHLKDLWDNDNSNDDRNFLFDPYSGGPSQMSAAEASDSRAARAFRKLPIPLPPLLVGLLVFATRMVWAVGYAGSSLVLVILRSFLPPPLRLSIQSLLTLLSPSSVPTHVVQRYLHTAHETGLPVTIPKVPLTAVVALISLTVLGALQPILSLASVLMASETAHQILTRTEVQAVFQDMFSRFRSGSQSSRNSDNNNDSNPSRQTMDEDTRDGDHTAEFRTASDETRGRREGAAGTSNGDREGSQRNIELPVIDKVEVAVNHGDNAPFIEQVDPGAEVFLDPLQRMTSHLSELEEDLFDFDSGTPSSLPSEADSGPETGEEFQEMLGTIQNNIKQQLYLLYRRFPSRSIDSVLTSLLSEITSIFNVLISRIGEIPHLLSTIQLVGLYTVVVSLLPTIQSVGMRQLANFEISKQKQINQIIRNRSLPDDLPEEMEGVIQSDVQFIFKMISSCGSLVLFLLGNTCFIGLVVYLTQGSEDVLAKMMLLSTAPFLASNIAILVQLYWMRSSPNTQATSRGQADDSQAIRDLKRQLAYVDGLLAGNLDSRKEDYIHRWSLEPSLRQYRLQLVQQLQSASDVIFSEQPYGGAYEYMEERHSRSKNSLKVKNSEMNGGKLSYFFSQTGRLVWTVLIVLSTLVATSSTVAGILDWDRLLEEFKPNSVFESRLSYLLSILNQMPRVFMCGANENPFSSGISIASRKAQLLFLCFLSLSLPIQQWIHFFKVQLDIQNGLTASRRLLQRAAATQTTLKEMNNQLAQDLNARRSGRQGWTTDGPDPTCGVQLQSVSIEYEGILVLRDATIDFPAGCVTVIVECDGGRGGSGRGYVGGTALSPKTAILESIFRDKSGGRVRVCSGSVAVRGRPAEEWDGSVLKGKMAYMRDDESFPQLPVGMISGLSVIDPYANQETVKERRSLAYKSSGVESVFQALPQGSATVLTDDIALSPAQRKRLSTCRVLCELHKDVILVDNAVAYENENEEAEFFRSLKSGLRSDQVVILTSPRFSSALHADKVVVISEGVVIQQGTYSQLISQPGLFRDHLIPTSALTPRAAGVASF